MLTAFPLYGIYLSSRGQQLAGSVMVVVTSVRLDTSLIKAAMLIGGIFGLRAVLC